VLGLAVGVSSGLAFRRAQQSEALNLAFQVALAVFDEVVQKHYDFVTLVSELASFPAQR
jgi:hypothetical protein